MYSEFKSMNNQGERLQASNTHNQVKLCIHNTHPSVTLRLLIIKPQVIQP